MSATLTNLETKVRSLIGDSAKTDYDIFTYDTSSVFTLRESNPEDSDPIVSVLKNDATLDTSSWSYDSDLRQVDVSESLSAGDTIKIEYSFYPKYSTNEVNDAIKSALIHLSINNVYTWIVEDDIVYPDPEEKEQNLIAIIAGLILEPDNKSYRLPDLSVIAPNDLPLHQKIRNVIGHYKKNTHGIFDIL